jgi:hypothetical protein
MPIHWKRTLRTSCSERFSAYREGIEVAFLDLHYLQDGTVSGTVVLLREAGWSEDDVPDLIASFDEEYLPDVDLALGNLIYTVVIGDILGNWEAEMDDES